MLSDKNNFSVALSYEGEDSDDHFIDMYDFAQALYGFERSLALVTHLVIHDEVITQATSLKDAKILAQPPQEGSFSIAAFIAIGWHATFKMTTLKKDNPLGHLVHSGYEYLVHKVTGRELDYDKSIRQLYEESQVEKLGLKAPKESKFASLAEKIEPPLTRLHRPIIKSATAEQAKITFQSSRSTKLPPLILDRNTFAGMAYRERQDEVETLNGIVSVFNPNTFNGRVFVPKLSRTVPFFLTPAGRSPRALKLIGESYVTNLNERGSEDATLEFDVFAFRKSLGDVARFSVIRVSPGYTSDVIDHE